MKETLYFAQKGIILNKSRDAILTSKFLNPKFNRGKLLHKLCLPGGKAEFDEDLLEAFKREIFEETGIITNPIQPIHRASWFVQKSDETQRIIAVFIVGIEVGGELKMQITQENDSVMAVPKWINLDQVYPADFVEDETPAIEKFLAFQNTNPFLIENS